MDLAVFPVKVVLLDVGGGTGRVSQFLRGIVVDALYHMVNQRQAAQELWHVLKPSGRIIIEEPDIRIFAVKLVALVEKLALMRSR